MKKIVSIMLMMSVMFSAAIISTAAESGHIRGDANGDGYVSIVDVTAIQRRLAGLSVSSFHEKAADVNGDGLDITDATRIQRFLAEYEDPYHICEFVADSTTPTRDEYELPFIPAY